MSRTDKSRRFYDEGRALMAAGDFENAALAFQRSNALEPHFKSLELLGECYLELDRALAAIAPQANGWIRALRE